MAMFLILVTLKVTGIGPVADLSWWWVTAPLFGRVILRAVGALATAVFLVLFTLKVAGIEPAADLSWWWVTAPLWARVIVRAVGVVAMLLFTAAGAIGPGVPL